MPHSVLDMKSAEQPAYWNWVVCCVKGLQLDSFAYDSYKTETNPAQAMIKENICYLR